MVSSPGLERFTDHLADTERPPILDLGSPVASNIDFLSQFDCVLHIADLHRVLSEDPGMSVPEEERDVDAVVGRAVSYEEHVRFDGILGWNLFDYLDAPVACALAERIALNCHSGTILLMITSTSDTIPDSPGRITIVDARNVRFERLSPNTRDGARHTPRSLQKMLPGFNLQHSFLLQEGMQDYVFVHE